MKGCVLIGVLAAACGSATSEKPKSKGGDDCEKLFQELAKLDGFENAVGGTARASDARAAFLKVCPELDAEEIRCVKEQKRWDDMRKCRAFVSRMQDSLSNTKKEGPEKGSRATG